MISHFRCLACRSNQIFRTLQLSVKVLEHIAEIIRLFGASDIIRDGAGAEKSSLRRPSAQSYYEYGRKKRGVWGAWNRAALDV